MRKTPKYITIFLSKQNWDALQEAFKERGISPRRRGRTIRKVVLEHFGIQPTRSLWGDAIPKGGVPSGMAGRPNKVDRSEMETFIRGLAGSTKAEKVAAIMTEFSLSRATAYREVNLAEMLEKFFANSKSTPERDDTISDGG